MNIPIIKKLLNFISLLITLSVSLIVFNINYYLMANLPGLKDNMCVIGAGLTPLNIIFSIILSVMAGIFVAALIELFKQRRAKLVDASVSGIGLVAGILTIFCTWCTIPVISLFGISFSLSIFVDYNLAFKIISILLMFTGLYLLNKQLKKDCLVCKT